MSSNLHKPLMMFKDNFLVDFCLSEFIFRRTCSRVIDVIRTENSILMAVTIFKVAWLN